MDQKLSKMLIANKEDNRSDSATLVAFNILQNAYGKEGKKNRNAFNRIN